MLEVVIVLHTTLEINRVAWTIDMNLEQVHLVFALPKEHDIMNELDLRVTLHGKYAVILASTLHVHTIC